MNVTHYTRTVDCDGLSVQYDLCCPGKVQSSSAENDTLVLDENLTYEQKSLVFEQAYGETQAEIERLTNTADGLDYAVSVCSGILVGVIDFFYVGDFQTYFQNSHQKIDEAFQKIVSKVASEIESKEKKEKIHSVIESAKKKAQEKGATLSDAQIAQIKERINNSYAQKNNLQAKIEKELEKARAKASEKGATLSQDEIKAIKTHIKNLDYAKKIKKIEDTFRIPSDSTDIWNVKGNSIDPKSHHLDDLAHHPTIIGWMASIVTQFTEQAYFQNKKGENLTFSVPVKIKIKKRKGYEEIQLIGDTTAAKFICGTINWVGHLISDMAGSNSSAKKGNQGMGLPGPIMSMLKEVSMLPIFRDTSLPELLYKAFTTDNGVLNQYRLDLRTELAIGDVLKKQSFPVLLNELFIRLFYFIRRLYQEIKINGICSLNDIKKINWKNTLPVKNRTIVRMLAISTGTMEAIDLVDAGIRSGGALPVFLLRVNFVGVGRFAIAGSTDLMMGIKKGRLELAMASAEVAKTAQAMHFMAEDVERQRIQTQEKLNRLTSKINGAPPIRNTKARSGFIMGHTVNNIDIEIDTSKFTPEEAKGVAEQIFSLKSEEFMRIKSEPWYRKFLKAVTFRYDGKKVIVSDIASLGKLQQFFLQVYKQHYAGLNTQLDQLIDNLERVHAEVERMRSGLELQEDIQVIDQDNAAILQLLLSEYEPKGGKEDEFQKYRRTVIKAFGDENPKGTFNTSMLGDNQWCHKIFCRCLYELAAIDECLENENFPQKIQNILDHLEVSEKDKEGIKQAVLRQVRALGIEYLINEKYQPKNFDWSGFEFEECHEAADNYAGNESDSAEESVSVTADTPDPYSEIKDCIKKHIDESGKPFGTSETATEELLQKLLPENTPAFKTVVAITKAKKVHMVFTAYAAYYISQDSVVKIPYSQMAPENVRTDIRQGKRVFCCGEKEIGNSDIADALKSFSQEIYLQEPKPTTDRLTPLEKLDVGVRIGYFRNIANILQEEGYPLFDLYQLVDANSLSDYWSQISSGVDVSVKHEFDAWKNMIPYPNEEVLCRKLLEDLCCTQLWARFWAKKGRGISLQDEKYYLTLLSDEEAVKGITSRVIQEQDEYFSAINEPEKLACQERRKKINAMIYNYECAIDTAKQAGYVDIQQGLESIVSRLKEKAAAHRIEENDNSRDLFPAEDELENMKKDARKVVYGFSASTAVTGAVPIPFADMPLLIGQQVTMLASVAKIFKISIGKEALQVLVGGAVGVSGASILGKTAVSSILKLVPGAGTVAGGALSAGTAGILTLAMGNAAIEYFAMIKKGKLSPEDITGKTGKDVFKTIFRAQLKAAKEEKKQDPSDV